MDIGLDDAAATGHDLVVTVRRDPTVTLLAVHGELDLLSASRLRKTLEAVLRANARRIAIDLTETTFMDSAGIHVLVDARHRAVGHLAVVCGDGQVRRAIELVGLVGPLNVVSSVDEYRARRARS